MERPKDWESCVTTNNTMGITKYGIKYSWNVGFNIYKLNKGSSLSTREIDNMASITSQWRRKDLRDHWHCLFSETNMFVVLLI